MFKVVSSLGNAAYKAAAKTGLAAGTEQPPYPCALPLHVVEDPNNGAEVQALADTVFEAAKDLIHNPNHAWKVVDYRDPDSKEGGDLVLLSKPHIGPYNFAKATMSFMNCSPERMLETVHGEDFEMRRKFSADLSAFTVIANPTPTTNIQYHEYYAPPPVSHRSLMYLVEKRYVPEEDAWYVYGCSIDYPAFTKGSARTIRAMCLWAWELNQVGANTLGTYVSCMNPNGWAPTFIVGWLKSEIGKELVSIRRVLYGQQALLERTTLDHVTGGEENAHNDGEDDETISGSLVSLKRASGMSRVSFDTTADGDSHPRRNNHNLTNASDGTAEEDDDEDYNDDEKEEAVFLEEEEERLLDEEMEEELVFD